MEKRVFTKEEIASFIDHTLLKPEATADQIRLLCEEAMQYRFHSVCVNSCRVKMAASILAGSGVRVCSVAGFPLGAMESASKAFEAEAAVSNGASEIDMVINVGALRDGRLDLLESDIRMVREKCGKGTILKAIIETCLLTDEEKVTACRTAVRGGADFVKTSTGFGSGGATAGDVKLMRDAVKERARIKASGGIRSYEDAVKMICSGADRLGTSSGITIVNSIPEQL